MDSRLHPAAIPGPQGPQGPAGPPPTEAAIQQAVGLLPGQSAASTDIIPTFVKTGTAVTDFILGDIPNEWQINASITDVLLGPTVTSIGNYAFNGGSIPSLIIPDSVITIGSYAFNYNPITSLIIPDSVTSLGDYAFVGSSITSVTIGNGVTTIGSRAFDNQPIATVILTAGRTIIPTQFAESTGLAGTLTIPDSVITIGSSAFYNTRIATVNIPPSVATLGNTSFGGYIAPLTVVNCYVPKSIIDASVGPFGYWSDLLTINVPASGPVADTWAAGTGLSIGGRDNVTVTKTL